MVGRDSRIRLERSESKRSVTERYVISNCPNWRAHRQANSIGAKENGSGCSLPFFCDPQMGLPYGDPNGTRTHVIGVRGQRPRPLDYGAMSNAQPV